ncbi:MAG TPA: type II secretion system minor pseudopilin GspJ [Sphingomicrobium sp.]|nr:type II secretion system minor pseudopilin GspJ [Sphingomicrobium sp.]
MKSNGFTLVEMLVALGIFALLATAGVGVLRSSVDVQSSVETRLDEMSGIARLNALLSNDLGQAVDRPSRGPGGERPAFVGRESGMEFVSAGRINLDGAPRSELQRVEWHSTDGALQRTGFASVDGADDGLASSMAGGLNRAVFRYRMLDGSWSSTFASSEQQRLPTAVELTMTRTDRAPVVMVFALPPGAALPQPKEQERTGGPRPDQLPPTERGE